MSFDFSFNDSLRRSWLFQLAVALGYVIAGLLVRAMVTTNPPVSVIWPGSGLAVGALLLGGWRAIRGIALGSLVLNALLAQSLPVVVGMTVANVAEAGVGWLLLTHIQQPLRSLRTLTDYVRLLTVGAVASVVGATLGTAALLLAHPPAPEYWVTAPRWWMGDTLGVALFAALFLTWNQSGTRRMTRRLVAEGCALLAITALVAHVIFMDGLHDFVSYVPHGYFLFLCITLVALRTGVRGTTLALAITAIQGALGAYHGIGLFAPDLTQFNLHNYAAFMLGLSLVGMAIATYADGIELALAALHASQHTLSNSEMQFRHILERAPIGMATLTQEGQITLVNQALCTMVNYSRTQLQSMTLLDMVHPDDQAAFLAAHPRLLSGSDEVCQLEQRYVRQDGHVVWARLTASRECDSKGRALFLIAQIEDITEHKKREWHLAKLSFALNHIKEAVFLIGEDAQFIYANDEACRMVGYGREELTGGMRVPDVHPGWRSARFKAFWHALRTQGTQLLETVHRTRDGQRIPIEVNANYFEYDGRGYNMAIVRDITRRKQVEDDLRITASVFGTSQEAIVITDAYNQIIDVNPAFTRITGYSHAEAVGNNPRMLSSGRQDRAFYQAMWQSLRQQGAWRGEIWNRRKSGETYPEQLSISAIRDRYGAVQRYVAVFSDITHVKAYEAELHQVANHDELTGVPNRRLLADRLSQAVARTQRSHRLLAVCYMDLDGFKAVNDLYGHEAGDHLLIAITRSIQEALRAGDTLARVGGDELVGVFNELASQAECLQILDRVLQIVAQPVPFGEWTLNVSASIGVAFRTKNNENADTLLRQADEAMYRAKQAGKSRYVCYQDSTP